LASSIKAVAAITLDVVKRTDPHSFQVVRRRWVVERTFGWLMRYRRPAWGYERRVQLPSWPSALGWCCANLASLLP
jgi:transposase